MLALVLPVLPLIPFEAHCVYTYSISRSCRCRCGEESQCPSLKAAKDPPYHRGLKPPAPSVLPPFWGNSWNRKRAAEYTGGKAAHEQLRQLYVRCVFRRDSGSLTFDVPPSETSSWRAVARVLRSPMDAVGCALFPACCALCGSPLPQLSSVPICEVCWTEFAVQSGELCLRCGDPLDAWIPAGAISAGPIAAGGTRSRLCRSCRLAPPPFERAVSYGPYDGRMRAAIHALKYDRLHGAAKRLGRMLAAAIAQLADEAPGEMLVVPVPLHRTKYSERGFNQARSLAVSALAALGKSHPAWRLRLASTTLMRLRATESQAGLTPRQRRLNVRRAFSVSDRAAVAGEHVLVIDDVFTTGATARAAAKTLVDAGAASVWVATLARARMRGGRAGSAWAEDDFHLSRKNNDAAKVGHPESMEHPEDMQGASIFSSHDQSSF